MHWLAACLVLAVQGIVFKPGSSRYDRARISWLTYIMPAWRATVATVTRTRAIDVRSSVRSLIACPVVLLVFFHLFWNTFFFFFTDFKWLNERILMQSGVNWKAGHFLHSWKEARAKPTCQGTIVHANRTLSAISGLQWWASSTWMCTVNRTHFRDLGTNSLQNRVFTSMISRAYVICTLCSGVFLTVRIVTFVKLFCVYISRLPVQRGIAEIIKWPEFGPLLCVGPTFHT